MIYYEDELITLYNGDCQEIIKDLVVDKIITSPPYNIVRPNSTDRGYDIYKDGMSNDEYIEWTIKTFNLYDRILNKNGAVIYNMSYGTENTEVMNLVVSEIIKRTNFTIADILVWKKKSATPNNVSSNKMTRIVEFVYVFCRRDEFNTFTSNKKIIGYREDTGSPSMKMFLISLQHQIMMKRRISTKQHSLKILLIISLRDMFLRVMLY